MPSGAAPAEDQGEEAEGERRFARGDDSTATPRGRCVCGGGVGGRFLGWCRFGDLGGRGRLFHTHTSAI